VGGWDALYRLNGGDGQKNAAKGPVEFLDTEGCYVEAARLTALVGVKDLVVIETADAILILRRDREAMLKKLVDRLEKKGKRELL
jgi:mannose-1-phosphate guanylyltransferase